MNKFPAPQFAQFAPPARKNYRDIPNQFDRMGQLVQPVAVPAGGFMPGAFAQGLAGPLQPVGLQVEGVAMANGGVCNVPAQNNAYERVVGLPRICIGGCESETAKTSVCGPFTLTGMYIAPHVARF